MSSEMPLESGQGSKKSSGSSSGSGSGSGSGCRRESFYIDNCLPGEKVFIVYLC